MYERILVGVDGSQCAETAARAGMALAAALDARVDVVSAMAIDGDGDPRGRRAARDRAEEALERVGQFALEAGVVMERHVREGRPVEAIATVADEVDAGLLVLGRHGQRGVRERLLGTTTHRVLRSTDRPLLVVPAAATLPAAPETLLATTDGSEAAERAAPTAGGLADALGAHLHVLSVADVRGAAGVFSAGGVDAAFREGLEAECTEAAERFADRTLEAVAPGAGRSAEGRELVVTTAVRRGVPHDVIAAYADEIDAAMVVMSSRGQGSLTGQLLGSVAERTLRVAELPVLVETVR